MSQILSLRLIHAMHALTSKKQSLLCVKAAMLKKMWENYTLAENVHSLSSMV